LGVGVYIAVDDDVMDGVNVQEMIIGVIAGDLTIGASGEESQAVNMSSKRAISMITVPNLILSP
jgi:hypothetical protein